VRAAVKVTNCSFHSDSPYLSNQLPHSVPQSHLGPVTGVLFLKYFFHSDAIQARLLLSLLLLLFYSYLNVISSSSFWPTSYYPRMFHHFIPGSKPTGTRFLNRFNHTLLIPTGPCTNRCIVNFFR